MANISMPRRRTLQRILAGIAAFVLPRTAAARSVGRPCALDVRAAARDLASWPNCFSGVGLRQQAMIHLRAAVRASMSGDEDLCRQELALSGHKSDCRESKLADRGR